MNLLCVHTGLHGRKIVKLMDRTIENSWTVIGNPDGHPTRRMLVYSAFTKKFTVADVPIPYIKLMDEETAHAYALLNDEEAKAAIVKHVLDDLSYSYNK